MEPEREPSRLFLERAKGVSGIDLALKSNPETRMACEKQLTMTHKR